MSATATSPFTAAMDETNHMELGENGSPQYSAEGVKDARVALFFALVRGIDDSRIKELINDVLKSTLIVKDETQKAIVIADLFLLTLQTRNCRGGKGEKDIFYELVLQLGEVYPKTVNKLLSLIPHYGCFKDWFVLVNKAETTSRCTFIVDTILNLAVQQLNADRDLFVATETTDCTSGNFKSKKSTTLSLLSKWAPREGKQFGAQAKQLASRLFPASPTPMKDYRQLLSKLNKALTTVEVKMSANQWDQIDFGCVPSVCLMKSRKAFLNEDLRHIPSASHDETGNRHPNDDVRVQCRKRLRESMLDTKVQKLKGKQLFPHEIISKIGVASYFSNQLSSLEKDLFECQWKDIRKSVVEAMEGMKDQASLEETQDKPELAINLGNLVPLVDVSGSMHGTPMEVAIALGLLVSEITSEAFANRCLTFSSRPQWVNFDKSASLSDKVKKLAESDWGYSTNFEAAIEMILQVAKKANLKPEDIPNLIVFSDMQFDQAHDGSNSTPSWETHHERIVRRFKETGQQVCGKEWPAPHIIYWNLRGDTTGSPVQADTPGVTMLSGFSPSLMKLLLDGEPLELEDEMEMNEDEVQSTPKKAKKDPYTTLRKALDDEEYDKVREVLYTSKEGLLKYYNPTEEVSHVVKDNDEWEIVSESS